jgi:hypothetical protein
MIKIKIKRYLTILSGTIYITLMIFANLIGYGFGLDGLSILMNRFFTLEGFFNKFE